MKKISKILIGLPAITAAVLPLATLTSCGKISDKVFKSSLDLMLGKNSHERKYFANDTTISLFIENKLTAQYCNPQINNDEAIFTDGTDACTTRYEKHNSNLNLTQSIGQDDAGNKNDYVRYSDLSPIAGLNIFLEEIYEHYSDFKETKKRMLLISDKTYDMCQIESAQLTFDKDNKLASIVTTFTIGDIEYQISMGSIDFNPQIEEFPQDILDRFNGQIYAQTGIAINDRFDIPDNITKYKDYVMLLGTDLSSAKKINFITSNNGVETPLKIMKSIFVFANGELLCDYDFGDEPASEYQFESELPKDTTIQIIISPAENMPIIMGSKIQFYLSNQ